MAVLRQCDLCRSTSPLDAVGVSQLVVRVAPQAAPVALDAVMAGQAQTAVRYYDLCPQCTEALIHSLTWLKPLGQEMALKEAAPNANS